MPVFKNDVIFLNMLFYFEIVSIKRAFQGQKFSQTFLEFQI